MASMRYGRYRLHPLGLYRSSSEDRSRIRACQYAIEEGPGAIQPSSSFQAHGVPQRWTLASKLRISQLLAVFPTCSSTPDPRERVPHDFAVDIWSLLYCSGRWLPTWYRRWWSIIGLHCSQLDHRAWRGSPATRSSQRWYTVAVPGHSTRFSRLRLGHAIGKLIASFWRTRFPNNISLHYFLWPVSSFRLPQHVLRGSITEEAKRGNCRKVCYTVYNGCVRMRWCRTFDQGNWRRMGVYNW